MDKDNKMAPENSPDEDDTLGGLNERYPFLNNSLGRSEFQLFLQNLHLSNQNQLSSAQQLFQFLQQENNIFKQNLEVQNNLAFNKKVQEQITNNNHLIHYLTELQNLLTHNEKLLIWLETQLRTENLVSTIIQNKEKTLEDKAREARLFHRVSIQIHTPFFSNSKDYQL